VLCSSQGCSLAQWKDIRPWLPEFGPEGKHFVSGNSLFLIFGGAAPVWRVYEPKKTGSAQRTGAHARPKPTINQITVYVFFGQTVHKNNMYHNIKTSKIQADFNTT
jgi:hypothetical protein